MPKALLYFAVVLLTTINACSSNKTKKETTTPFLSAREVVLLNQLIYKDNLQKAFAKYAPEYDLVFIPTAVNGNFAFIAKRKQADQYALVIRGSLIEFSNAGFQNFILQDFNIFTIKKWEYADSVQEAYISNGTYTGFQNLLQLRDGKTGLTLREFIEQKITAHASIVISGHSLGGNLAYPFAGYIKKQLPAERKNNLQLITFGAPAAGNSDFVQDMDEKFPTAHRFVTDKDIAPLFPDLDQIHEMAKKIGLDSVLQISGPVKTSDLLNLAGEILEQTNVINKTNKYVQSMNHFRLLTFNDTDTANNSLSVDAIFNKAYLFHKVDTYAELLGGKPIN